MGSGADALRLLWLPDQEIDGERRGSVQDDVCVPIGGVGGDIVCIDSTLTRLQWC